MYGTKVVGVFATNAPIPGRPQPASLAAGRLCSGGLDACEAIHTGTVGHWCPTFLTSFGYSGQLEALARADFDLVLMDCQMPEMDGYEATRRIRENSRSGAHPQGAGRGRDGRRFGWPLGTGLESGMGDYIATPVQPKVLKEVLENG